MIRIKLELAIIVFAAFLGDIITPDLQTHLLEFAWRSGATIFGIIFGNFVLKFIKSKIK